MSGGMKTVVWFDHDCPDGRDLPGSAPTRQATGQGSRGGTSDRSRFKRRKAQVRSVEARVTLPSRQLLAFGFNAGAAFEGQLVGALEKLESGGALGVIDSVRGSRRGHAINLEAIRAASPRSSSISGWIPPRDAGQLSWLSRTTRGEIRLGCCAIWAMVWSPALLLQWCSSSTSGPEGSRMLSRASAAGRWRAKSSTPRSCRSWRQSF